MQQHHVRPDLFTRELIEHILAPYGLSDGAGLAIQPMPQGFGMALVRLRHPDFDLVVKQLSPDLPPERIRFALRVQARLHEAGVPCPRLRPTASGEYLIALANHQFCLQDWCGGEHIDIDAASTEERRHYRRQLGKLLGQVHGAATSELIDQAPPSCRRPPQFLFTNLPAVEAGLPWSRGGRLARHLWLLCHETGDFGRDLRRALPLLREVRRRLAASPAAADPSLADVLPVHGDFHFENVLFDGGRVSGLIDFDNATVAPRAYDLGSAMAVICQEREHEDDFLAAYTDGGGGSLPARDLLRTCVLLRLFTSLSFQMVAYTRRQIRSPEKSRWWIRRLIRLLTFEVESV
ncbi:MAG: phosphotransferase [Candidatus Krumholzibacteria bacterium]|jgi:Ser/Thr protein kinase RdoA (MazF antagonist)|nr:phosphotransferase [Candidatus Krumholzibacteria bacterium]